jgi:hypothetical protein
MILRFRSSISLVFFREKMRFEDVEQEFWSCLGVITEQMFSCSAEPLLWLIYYFYKRDEEIVRPICLGF